jgi:hypothetical protein
VRKCLWGPLLSDRPSGVTPYSPTRKSNMRAMSREKGLHRKRTGSFLPTMRTQRLTPVYEEIPKVLRRRDPTRGFEMMSKSRSGTAHEQTHEQNSVFPASRPEFRYDSTLVRLDFQGPADSPSICTCRKARVHGRVTCSRINK